GGIGAAQEPSSAAPTQRAPNKMRDRRPPLIVSGAPRSVALFQRAKPRIRGRQPISHSADIDVAPPDETDLLEGIDPSLTGPGAGGLQRLPGLGGPEVLRPERKAAALARPRGVHGAAGSFAEEDAVSVPVL